MSNHKFNALLNCFDTMWLYFESFREYCKGIHGFLWFDDCYDRWMPNSTMLENVLKIWAANNDIFNDDEEIDKWYDRNSDEEFYVWQRDYAKNHKLVFYKKAR